MFNPIVDGAFAIFPAPDSVCVERHRFSRSIPDGIGAIPLLPSMTKGTKSSLLKILDDLTTLPVERCPSAIADRRTGRYPKSVPKAFTITFLLPDGRPDGLRIVAKSNWIGRGVDFSRADWPQVRSRPEFLKPGVYVLTGLNDEGEPAIYVGEADELRNRLNQHYAGLDFWTRAVAFLSKDERT